MKQKRIYGLLAWVILFAFSAMMIVKDTHYLYHHAHCCGDCCVATCVLDGKPLDCRHHHDHSSLLALESSDDHCAICQFQVVKVQKPNFTVYLAPVTAARLLRVIFAAHYQAISLFSVSPRAPPVC